MFQERITAALAEVLKKLGIQVFEVVLEHPGNLANGDYATNIALVAAKRLGASPRELAERIVKGLGAIEGVSKIKVAGPGFINFHLARESYAGILQNACIESDRWGSNDKVRGYKVIVEYSQPNPFKPFHIGHLMSTTVGESISRLVEYSGASLFRANYQGDIGPHVAKCLWGLSKKGLDAASVQDLGEAYVAGAAAYEDNPKAKEEIDALNKKLYAGDPSLKELYDTGRKASLARFEELYRILGTKFDKYFFESESAPTGLGIVKEGLTRGIFEESDGAIVYRGERHGLHTRVFITSQGLPTYETKEIGLVKLKRSAFPFDLNITTVAVEQNSYFQVVEKAIEELWPELKGKYTHVTHGMMQLSGGKMSSRKGNVVTGESLIEEMRAKAYAKMEGRNLPHKKVVADQIAVAAIKYSVLKQATGKNIVFDPEQSLSFEGDSGPYLQYSHVRAMSVLKKSGVKNSPIYGPKKGPEAVAVFERLLPRFPEVVARAAEEYEPHYVTTYITELASAFNNWYAGDKIIGSEHEAYKLMLVASFAQTIKNGLWLLGIEAPEKM